MLRIAQTEEGRRERGRGREEWVLRRGSSEAARPVEEAAGVLKSTWELLLPIWDVEERPEAMQHVATVNAMTLENVFAYKLHWEQQNKKEGKGDGSFGRDKKLPLKRFEAEDDNCGDKLHCVSGLVKAAGRQPPVPPSGIRRALPLTLWQPPSPYYLHSSPC